MQARAGARVRVGVRGWGRVKVRGRVRVVVGFRVRGSMVGAHVAERDVEMKRRYRRDIGRYGGRYSGDIARYGGDMGEIWVGT